MEFSCVLTSSVIVSSDTTMDIRPNHTIYINNISDKVKKEGERAFPRCVRTSARVHVSPPRVSPGVRSEQNSVSEYHGVWFPGVFAAAVLLMLTAQRTDVISPT